MKVSLNWLNDYVEVSQPATKVAQILSDIGLPVESIEAAGDDTVIDVEVTSNRGDCLGHIGIAREFAAATGKKLRPPEVNLSRSQGSTGPVRHVSEFVDVSIEDPRRCGRYTGRVIYGIRVGPTPEWMRKRLEAVGIRSVNNVVDAANYAMMESGQPPHAFDYDKLSGRKIIVRMASAGEKLVSIDGTKCELDGNTLIIADAKGPVAVAGVMGGFDTEISASTTTVMLEDAHFDPVCVRTTARRLGLSSEASYRFERIVDIETINWASQRCAELIAGVAGGTVADGLVDVYPGKWSGPTVGMRLSRLGAILGISVPRDSAIQILNSLGLAPQVKIEDLIVCTIPSWRHDISREIDLIEEVGRSYGYDRIPVERRISIEVATVDKRQKCARSIRTYLNGCGFYETVNVTFVDSPTAELFSNTADGPCLAVSDESRKSANLLRQNLTGSLMTVLKSNRNANNSSHRLYEIADTFKPRPAGTRQPLPAEATKVAMVLEGNFREIKGVVCGLIGLVNRELKVEFVPVQLPWASVAADVLADGTLLGQAGILSADAAAKFDLPSDSICLSELDFDILEATQGDTPAVKPLPRFPTITRDLSLIVDETIRWADIVAAINRQNLPQLEDVQFTAIYRGKPIEPGRKSITVSLRFRDDDGTLTHQVVDAFEQQILDTLARTVNAQIRTA